MGKVKETDLLDALNAIVVTLDVLREARAAMYVHPRRSRDPWSIESSMVRIGCLVLVDSFEMILELLENPPFYLAVHVKSGASNEERLRALHTGLTSSGVSVSCDTIEDLLAIKYLRNTITHAGKNSAQIDHIKARGFPEQILRGAFPAYEVFERLLNTMSDMLRAILSASSTGPGFLKDKRLHLAGDLLGVMRHRSDLSAVIRPPEIEMIWWNNIELIYHSVRNIYRPLTADELHHAIDLTIESWGQLDSLFPDSDSLNSASQFLLRCFDDDIVLEVPYLSTDLNTLISPTEGEGSQFSAWMGELRRVALGVALPKPAHIWDDSIPEDVGFEFLRLCFGDSLKKTEPRLMLLALRVGNAVYQRWRYRTAVDLSKMLIEKSEYRRHELLQVHLRTTSAFHLRSVWYEYVESSDRVSDVSRELREQFKLNVEVLPNS